MTLAARTEASQPVNLAAAQTVAIITVAVIINLIIMIIIIVVFIIINCQLSQIVMIVMTQLQVSLVGAGGQTVSLLSSPGGHGGDSVMSIYNFTIATVTIVIIYSIFTVTINIIIMI